MNVGYFGTWRGQKGMCEQMNGWMSDEMMVLMDLSLYALNGFDELKGPIDNYEEEGGPHSDDPVTGSEVSLTIGEPPRDKLERLIKEDHGDGELHHSQPLIHRQRRHLEYSLQKHKYS